MIAGRPRALIADDDPVSLRYLCGALEQCGCDVLAADGFNAALRLLPAARRSIDLLLLDRRMPGGGGIELLHALRAAGVVAPAIATSAELDAHLTQSLLEAGFAATLRKPAPLADIQRSVARFIEVPVRPATSSKGLAAPSILPLLDDAAALAAVGGDAAGLRALRGLFAAELAVVRDQLVRIDATSAGDRLHRLRASCGICGALQLRAAAERLEYALRQDAERAGEVLREFTRVCNETTEALAAQRPV